MRADKFLSEQFGSRTKAKEALERGLVLRAGKAVSPSDELSSLEGLVFCDPSESFVSNGGYKLARALYAFDADVSGAVFCDLGASTGGFTDCLLQRGAARVYCVDVGESQLDARLRCDPRITVMDGTNARYLTRDDFPEPLNGIVCDLSFISLKHLLPVFTDLLPAGGRAFVLFKPQFECEGKGLGKRGILPVSRHLPLLKRFYEDCTACGLAPKDIVNTPLKEKKNVEYMVLLEKGGSALPPSEWLARAKKTYESRGEISKST